MCLLGAWAKECLPSLLPSGLYYLTSLKPETPQAGYAQGNRRVYHLPFYLSSQCPDGFSWMSIPLEQEPGPGQAGAGTCGDRTAQQHSKQDRGVWASKQQQLWVTLAESRLCAQALF